MILFKKVIKKRCLIKLSFISKLCAIPKYTISCQKPIFLMIINFVAKSYDLIIILLLIILYNNFEKTMINIFKTEDKTSKIFRAVFN